MAVQRTFSIIKPDAVAKNVIGKITTRFEDAGLRVVASKLKQLFKAEAEGSESAQSSEGEAEAEAKWRATEAETEGARIKGGAEGAAEEEVNVVEQPSGRNRRAQIEACSTTCEARQRALCANAHGRSHPGVGDGGASRNC